MAVVFANTGEENEETLKFVRDCAIKFKVDVIWVEANVNMESGKGTTHKIVNRESNKVDPVGLPMVSVAIKIIAVKIPAKLCAINLGSGLRFLTSSHNPINPKNNAGPNTELANQNVEDV